MAAGGLEGDVGQVVAGRGQAAAAGLVDQVVAVAVAGGVAAPPVLADVLALVGRAWPVEPQAGGVLEELEPGPEVRPAPRGGHRAIERLAPGRHPLTALDTRAPLHVIAQIVMVPSEKA